MSATDEAFEITGLIRTQVTDLELHAADIADNDVDQLVDHVRMAVVELGQRLTELRRLERASA